MVPTLRKEGSELWAVWNPETDYDPIYVELWLAHRDDVVRIELEQGDIDNPYFPDVLKNEMETDYRNNPDEALHVWGGQPRAQGDNAVLSRVAIRATMNRKVQKTEPDEIGADIARFGNDKTEIFRRSGAKVIAHKELYQKDTVYVANVVWDMADKKREVVIKVDVGGMGAGTVDKLRELGANVVEINFGGSPKNKKKYTSCADEMWFNFADIINEIEIPNDSKLMEDLSGRKYDYDKLGRRKVEPKEEFRKRYGRSPDKADALIMAFYADYIKTGSVVMVKMEGL
jgi:hypothetical protein